jgi:phenylalanyl-tRNA synthetase alpha chain
VVEEQIQQLQSAALARIEEAKDLDALEQVRVDVLGRKGSLAQFNLGKLPAEERKVAGKALNTAKQTLESAFETRKQAFAAGALDARLRAPGREVCTR